MNSPNVSEARELDALRLRVEELETQLHILQIAKTAAGLGVYEYDALTGEAKWDARTCDIWGRDLNQPVNYAVFAASIYPDDLAPTEAAIQRAFDPAGDSHYVAEYRIVHGKTGSLRWVRATGFTFFRDGRATRLVGTVEDITDRKTAEASAQAASAELRLVSDAVPVYIAHCDRDGRFLFVNRAYAARLNLTVDQVVGRLIEEVLGADARERVRPYIERVLNGETVEFETERASDAGTRVFRRIYVPERGAGGEVRGWIAVVIDVTSRRKMERDLGRANAALSRERKQLAMALQASRMGVFERSKSQNTLWWSPEMFSVVGVDPQTFTVTPENFDAMVHPDDRNAIRQRFNQAIEAGEDLVEHEFRVIGPDGQVRWIASRSQFTRDESGELDLAIGVAMDATDRKRYEDELRASEARFRAVADTVPDLLFTNNPDGSCDYTSQNFLNYTGRTADQITGFGWLQILHPEDGKLARDAWTKAAATGEPFEMEARFRRHDGVYHWFIARANPLRDSDGNIVKWFGAATDIDAHRQIEDGLRAAINDLNQIAYAVAHDLREPLRNLAVSSEILLGIPSVAGDERAVWAQQTIKEGVDRMDLLLRDILDYSHAARGDGADVSKVDTAVALLKALGNLREAIRESGTVVETTALPEVRGHESQIIRLFQNLVSNAIKYRGQDAPLVRISAIRREFEWFFSVQDNGIGIDPEYHQIIFGMFKRLHGRSIPGTGIGLALCAKIVESAGGRLWVESTPGNGATFCFTWPAFGD